MCITNLLKKQPEKLNVNHQAEFENLKAKILKDCELHLPKFNKSFIVYTDASDKAIAGGLIQEYDEGKHASVLWASRTLLPHECNHSSTDKGFLVAIWSIKKFKVYLRGNFVLKTDHQAIVGIMSKKETTNRLTRLRNSIQEFNFTVEYISGSLNKFSDFLSRSQELELNVIDLSEKERELVKQIHEECGHVRAENIR